MEKENKNKIETNIAEDILFGTISLGYKATLGILGKATTITKNLGKKAYSVYSYSIYYNKIEQIVKEKLQI